MVGLKATYGRVPEHGVFPITPSLGHLGPIAPTVFDCALAYSAMAFRANHADEPANLVQPTPTLEGFGNTADLKDVRIGIYEPFFNHASEQVVSVCKTAVDRLVARGAKVVKIIIPYLEECRVCLASFFFALLVVCSQGCALYYHLERDARQSGRGSPQASHRLFACRSGRPELLRVLFRVRTASLSLDFHELTV